MQFLCKRCVCFNDSCGLVFLLFEVGFCLVIGLCFSRYLLGFLLCVDV